MKFVLWFPPEHWLNFVRLALVLCWGAVGLRETFQFLGKNKIQYHLYFQTPFGTAVINMDYDQTFEEKLKSVEKNYYSSYLVEFFEKRTPRNLESITVDWKSV